MLGLVVYGNRDSPSFPKGPDTDTDTNTVSPRHQATVENNYPGRFLFRLL